MSATKRIDGTYTIESAGSGTINLGESGGSDTVIIPGDLTVQGTTTTISSDDLFVKDKIITLNDGEAGPGVSAPFYSGITVDRGDNAQAGHYFAQLLWSEADLAWLVDIGDGAGPVLEIVTGAIGAPSGMQDLIDDVTAQVGGTPGGTDAAGANAGSGPGLDIRGLQIFTSNAGGSLPLSINVPLGNTNNLELSVSNSASNIVLTASGLNSEIILAGPVLLQGGAPNTTPAGTEAALFKGADTGGGTQVHYQNDTDTGELVSKTKAITYSLIF